MANYVLLESIQLTASAASVTFNNIPQTGYTDLKIVSSTRADGSFTQAQFNGDTGANYSMRFLRGNGSTAAYNTSTIFGAGVTEDPSYTANTFSNDELVIPNYNVSGIQKTGSCDSVMENNATATYMPLISSKWTGTAAITSIKLQAQSGGLFVQYSTFSLYGLAATGTTPAIYPKASGGQIIETDGTYWYHAFLYSGTFTPATTLSCDVLQIAGGGGGAPSSASSGGSGAGGVSYVASQSLAVQPYAVTVGAGGAGATINSSYVLSVAPTNGTNSQLGSLTAAVGGGSAPNTTVSTNGVTGGSGSGGTTNSGTGGSGTAGQGNNGGNAGTNGNFYSGGGGGAGAAGGAGTSGLAAGGVGTSAYSAWGLATGTGQNVAGTVYYAGGGGGSSNGFGGGAGGYGGGGAGASTNGVLATAGTANTGGGTGGGSNSGGSVQTAPGGGSGIVIVRYAVA